MGGGKGAMEKTTSASNRQVIKRILAQDGNNRCADCKTSLHPRWASWNIGILICIRCSGVHRSLGTHISKVRSIDLDTWNDQQLEKLVEFGNKRANAYWEAKLPPNYVPDESKIPSFIKTKYELKRWCGSEADLSSQPAQAPPQVPPKVRSDSPFNANPSSSAASTGSFGSFSNARSSAPPSVAPSVAPSAASSTANSSTVNSRTSSSHSSAVDLLNLDFSQPSSSSPSAKPSLRQPPVQPAAQKDRNDVKKSILSLYSQPVKPTPAQQRPQFGQFQQASSSSSSLNNTGFNNTGLSSTSSLNSTGLNNSGFNSSSSVNSTGLGNSGMSNSGTGNSGFGGFTSGNDFDDDFSSVWK